MKCDEIRALLNPYVDGELSGAEAEQVKRHLEGCAACAKEVAGLNKVKEMLCKLPVRPAPDALLERVGDALARPANEKKQTINLFWRYRWLAGSLASAAAVVLAVFIALTQPRKNDIEAPPPADGSAVRHEENTKVSPDIAKPITAKAEVADSIQPQPMLYTQQINISTRNISGTIERLYYVASLDMDAGRVDDKYAGKSGGVKKKVDKATVADDKDLLVKAQNRQAIISNVAIPYREARSQFESSFEQREEKSGQQILKVTIPLSQKDEFIRQLRGNITDKIVFAEMQAVFPAERPDGAALDFLAEGKSPGGPDAKEKRPEPVKESGKAGREYDTMARAGGGRGSVGKQAESNKIETEKSSKAKDETAEKKETEKPKASPGATAMKPAPSASSESPGAPPPPPAAAPPPASPATPSPPASRPAEGLVQSPSDKKKEESKDAATEKQGTLGDIQNEVVSQTHVTTGQAAQVQQTTVQAPDAELHEPMVEFIIIIEPEPPAAKEK